MCGMMWMDISFFNFLILSYIFVKNIFFYSAYIEGSQSINLTGSVHILLIKPTVQKKTKRTIILPNYSHC